MTSTFTRLYADEGQASRVAAELKAIGYKDSQMNIIAGGDSSGGDSVAQLRNAGVYETAANVYAKKVAQGNAVLVLRAAFGRAAKAVPVLDAHDPIETEVKFTEVIGFSRAKPSNIIRPTGQGSVIRRRMNPAKRRSKGSSTPFSKMFGMKTIIQPKKRKSLKSGSRLIMGVMPSLATPKRKGDRPRNLAPASSTFGFPLIIRKRMRASS